MSISFAIIAIAATLIAIQVLLLIADWVILLIFFVKCIKKIGIKKAIQIGGSEESEKIEIKKAMEIGDGERVESLGIKRGKKIRELEDIMLSSPRLMHTGDLIRNAAYWPMTIIKNHFSR